VIVGVIVLVGVLDNEFVGVIVGVIVNVLLGVRERDCEIVVVGVFDNVGVMVGVIVDV